MIGVVADGGAGHMWGTGMGWGGMGWFGGVFMLLVIGLLVYLVVRVASDSASSSTSSKMPAPEQSSARRILEERLARGDIELDDYRARVAALSD